PRAVIDRITGVAGVMNVAPLTPRNDRWLLVQAERNDAGLPRRVLEAIADQGPVFVVTLGPEVNIHNFDEALFHWLANMDPGRDGTEGRGGFVCGSRPERSGRAPNGESIRDWPPILEGRPIGPLQ